MNLASPSRYWAMNALVRKSRPSASTMRYWTVSSIRFLAGSMARPHNSTALPFRRFASVSDKADAAVNLLVGSRMSGPTHSIGPSGKQSIRPGAVAAVAGYDGLAVRRVLDRKDAGRR